MTKGKVCLGLGLLVAAFGCGSSNSASPDGGASTGRAGAGTPTAGNRGAGGSAGTTASNQGARA